MLNVVDYFLIGTNVTLLWTTLYTWPGLCICFLINTTFDIYWRLLAFLKVCLLPGLVREQVSC